MPEKKQPYLTLDELADELGCTRRDVDAIIERGELPLLRLAPERELVPRMALDAYQRRLRGEPSLTIEVELGGMVGLDSGAVFLGIETDELIDLLDLKVLPWGFDERGRRLMFPDDLRAHRMKQGYGENALRVIADVNSETDENTGDDEELDDEDITRMVDERLPAADATLGTDLDEVAVELGFDPAGLFRGESVAPLHNFRFFLGPEELLTDEVIDQIIEACHHDVLVGGRDQLAFVEFDREAPVLADAVITALHEVERVPGIHVVKIETGTPPA